MGCLIELGRRSDSRWGGISCPFAIQGGNETMASIPMLPAMKPLKGQENYHFLSFVCLYFSSHNRENPFRSALDVVVWLDMG